MNITKYNINNIQNNSIFQKMVKIQKLPSGQLVITIPKRIAEYEGLGKGLELDFRKHKEGFLIVKRGVK